MIRAVVFDMDGVIFDSERLLTRCWLDVTKEDGIPRVEETCDACLGVNDAETKLKFLEVYGEDFPYDAYEKRVIQLFRERSKDGKLPKKEGVEELLSYLKKQGMKVALATSSSRAAAEREIEEGGLLSYFDSIVCGDMIKRSKPQPDIYLKACECLGVEPGDAAAIEDSFNGVRSAYRAGLTVIMVPDIKKPDEEMRELASEIFPSLTEVKEYVKQKIHQ